MECGEVVAESSSVGGVGASSEWRGRVLASTLATLAVIVESTGAVMM